MKIIIFVALTIIGSSIHCSSKTCDFSFGYDSWEYAKPFFNKTLSIDAGKKLLEVEFQKCPGHMISYICLNVFGTNTRYVKASFASLFQKLKVQLDNPQKRKVTIQVVAKQHGY